MALTGMSVIAVIVELRGSGLRRIRMELKTTWKMWYLRPAWFKVFTDPLCGRDQIFSAAACLPTLEVKGLRLSVGAFNKTSIWRKKLARGIFVFREGSNSDRCVVQRCDFLESRIRCDTYRWLWKHTGCAHNRCIHDQETYTEDSGNVNSKCISLAPGVTYDYSAQLCIVSRIHYN